MRFPSIQNQSFAQVPSVNIQRSAFDRSSSYKSTFNAGFLIPIYIDADILPGDTWNVRAAYLARLTTPIVPVMDNLYLDTFWFFVPNRLVWSNWQKFCGEQINPGDSIDYLVPQMVSGPGGFTLGGLADYFGIPTGVPANPGTLSVNALPFRAYFKIWNEWFRDQNLQASTVVPMGDGPDSSLTLDAPLQRGKRHDYLTSCLPWPQKGTAVTIPITQAGSIITDNNDIFFKPGSGGSDRNISMAAGNALNYSGAAAGGTFAKFGSSTGLQLSATALGTINALRQSVQIQRMLEKDARTGTRYIEILKGHFGVTSPDARLQRPEYLGGGRLQINFHPVTQTSSTDATTPQGNLAAMAVGSGQSGGFSKSFVEHGILMCLATITADMSYQQGLDRMWSRRTRYDYYWPSLAHLGEQAVLNKEINAGHTTPDGVWGYQERFGEYRYKQSHVTNLFRSSSASGLDIWHLAQTFGSSVALNNIFIQDNPPIDRVVATPDEPNFRLDAYFKTRTARPMPMYSAPGMMDRF